MRNFFWPTNLKSDPSVLCRLGRVLHWVAVGGCLCLAALVALSIYEAIDLGRKFGEVVGGSIDYWLGFAFWFAILIIPLFLAGRATRYILSGE